MAPTSSDEQTGLAQPETPSTPPDSGSSPFGDWREQLRERVKEIRARKHAAHRDDVDELALDAAAAAATAEKLEAARAQAVDATTDAVDELEILPAQPEVAAEPLEAPRESSFAEDPAPEATALSEPEELADESDIEEDEVPASPDVAPLFQEETTVFADDPILEIEDEFRGEAPTTLEAEPEPEPASEPEFEPQPIAEFDVVESVPEAEEISRTDVLAEEARGAEVLEAESVDDLAAESTNLGAATAVPAWAKETESEFAPDPIHVESRDAEAPTSDSSLDSIPPELRDVDIPAWALPREPSLDNQEPLAEPTLTLEDDGSEIAPPTEDNSDAHLVGDFTTPTTEKRTDLGPPPETPIPTAELLDQSIGDLSALADEEVEIAPPGSLVDDLELEAEKAPRSLPGLFDGPEEPEPASSPLDDVVLADTTDANQEVSESATAEEPTVDELAESALASLQSDPAVDTDAPTRAEKVAVDTTTVPEPETAIKAPLFDEPAPAVPTPFDAALDAAEDGNATREADAPESTSSEMEWDVDDGLDAELVASAREQAGDASAPVSDRVASALADALVLMTIGFVLMIAGASAAGVAVVPFVQAAPLPFFAAWALFGLVYGVIFVGTSGQTLGKMAMRVRVIGADTFHVGYARAALRAVAYAAAALPAGLGLLAALKDPEQRGLHDRLTATRVVKA